MILEGALIKQLGILLISAVKFQWLPRILSFRIFISAYTHQYQYWWFVRRDSFLFLSRMLIRFYLRHFPLIFRAIEQVSGVRLGKNNITERPKARVFNRRNRLIIKIRNSYGFAGIIILTPVLLSIPIGTFLALKYYSKNAICCPCSVSQ